MEKSNLSKVIVNPSDSVMIGADSIIGTRDYQEDAASYYMDGRKCLAVLCDGMGGLNGGEFASATAVKMMLDSYAANKVIYDYPEFFYECAVKADKAVYDLRDAHGDRMKAGTTMVSVAIEGNSLYWLSVGDSRIYIIRDNKVFVANEEHNYATRLNRMLKSGQINIDSYNIEIKRGAALTSYIGIGNVYLMDINEEPFKLRNEDIIILSSDGMYRKVTSEMILEIINKHGDNLDAAAEALTSRAMELATKSQDNTTVEIIKFRF